ncbi:MAG: rRNA maturation RNase YbeY [Prolixibacteraceae bacterium]
MVNFFNEDVAFKLKGIIRLRKWISEICKLHDKSLGELSYILCSNQYILKINKDFLNHNYFTDIITFNYNEGNKISGDIFISIETVKENSIDYNVSFENELRRVIIHGILHLIGFDDKTDDQKLIMRQKEDEALNIF